MKKNKRGCLALQAQLSLSAAVVDTVSAKQFLSSNCARANRQDDRVHHRLVPLLSAGNRVVLKTLVLERCARNAPQKPPRRQRTRRCFLAKPIPSQPVKSPIISSDAVPCRTRNAAGLPLRRVTIYFLRRRYEHKHSHVRHQPARAQTGKRG